MFRLAFEAYGVMIKWKKKIKGDKNNIKNFIFKILDFFCKIYLPYAILNTNW